MSERRRPGGRPNRGTGKGRYLGEAKGTRQPFQPGHLLSVKHGAKSPRLVEARAADFVDAASAAIPWLADASFSRAVLAWARAEARCDLLADYLDREGLFDENGDTRPAADLAVKFERQAADARGKLGLDPTARARLEKELADAGLGQARLEAAMQEGRTLRLAAEAEIENEWDWEDVS